VRRQVTRLRHRRKSDGAIMPLDFGASEEELAQNYEVVTEEIPGRSLGRCVQLNACAILQLLERVEVLEEKGIWGS